MKKGLCECGCGIVTNIAHKTCNRISIKKGQHYRFRRGHHAKGKGNGRWNGGRKLTRGYVMIYRPNHPKQIKNYVSEHRLVMEEYIGRYLLSGECIHHKNDDHADNRIENLILTNFVDHIKIYHSYVGVSTRFKPGQNKGKKLSEETKRRIGDAVKLRWAKRRASRNNNNNLAYREN